jgi:hypothetical protein
MRGNVVEARAVVVCTVCKVWQSFCCCHCCCFKAWIVTRLVYLIKKWNPEPPTVLD